MKPLAISAETSICGSLWRLRSDDFGIGFSDLAMSEETELLSWIDKNYNHGGSHVLVQKCRV